MSHAIRIHAHGGPEAMRWEEVDPGSPAAGEVLVRQHAVGVNFIDVYKRTGLYPMALPSGLGQEACGVVEAVGAGVDGFAVGDRVAYVSGPAGSYATHRCVAAGSTVRLPDGIGFETAAAMMLKGLTVQSLLKRTLPAEGLEPGDWVVWHAAAGGVGLIACQWARALGLKLIATAGGPDKCRLALEHGAAEAIDYRGEDWVARIKSITGGHGVKVVYDSVGKDTFDGSLDVLRPFGLMVVFGNASGPVAPVSPGTLAAKGSLYLTRPTLFTHIAEPTRMRAMAADLFSVVERGDVAIRVDQRFALKDAADAHRALEARKTTGSTVLLPD